MPPSSDWTFMDILIPLTVRQAKWLIVGGVFALAMGVMRGVAFFAHGGVMLLVLCVPFVCVGIASIVGSAMRIRRGEPSPTDDSR